MIQYPHGIFATSLFVLLLGCSADDADTANDAGMTQESGVDATTDTNEIVETSTEAATEAATDASSEAATEASTDAAAEASGPRTLATIQTTMGTIVVELYPSASPVTVDNFKKYADASYYDGLLFHRVIPDFMIQGGGLEPGLVPRATLYPPIVNEAASSGLSNTRGTIAMARRTAPDSATSQFFINTVDNDFLDPGGGDAGYAVFGAVVEGMEVVDAISAVDTHTVGGYDDVPVTDVVIESITVAEE